MKKVVYILFATFILSTFSIKSYAQFDAGADIVSSYIWRGTTLADGPSIQPWVSYSTGGEDVSFEVGAWGSYAFFGNAFGQAFSEADLYATLNLGPVSLTVTDYFFPSLGLPYFDYETAHTLEASLGAEIGGLSLLAAYNFAGARDLGPIVDDATDGIDDPGIYFETSYALENGLSLFLGFGDEFYGASNNEDKSFGIVNLGLGYEKEIKGIPAFGQVVLNPSAETFGIVFGVSF